jgi:hypothetical protein
VSALPFLPSRVGLDALAEVDSVDWSTLRHAYGRGVVGTDLAGDVAKALSLLRDDPTRALNDGLWSNVCHQGTVYEATAYALPFIAAVAAGFVSTDLRSALSTLLGDIAINGSYVAPGGSHSGSFGEGVGALIQQTMTRCDPYLDSIEQIDQKSAPLVAAIRLLITEPSDENREKVDDIIDSKD